MSEYSPLEIIESLDVDEIDEQIEQLSNDIAALKELRKVARKRSGGDREEKSGNASPRAERGASRSVAEISQLVTSALSAGPLSMSDLIESTGLNHGHLRPHISSIPGVKKNAEGLWSLAKRNAS